MSTKDLSEQFKKEYGYMSAEDLSEQFKKEYGYMSAEDLSEQFKKEYGYMSAEDLSEQFKKEYGYMSAEDLSEHSKIAFEKIEKLKKIDVTAEILGCLTKDPNTIINALEQRRKIILKMVSSYTVLS